MPRRRLRVATPDLWLGWVGNSRYHLTKQASCRPAHKFTRVNYFKTLAALWRAAATPKAELRTTPNPTASCLKERSQAPRLEVQFVASLAPPGASFEAASRRLRTS